MGASLRVQRIDNSASFPALCKLDTSGTQLVDSQQNTETLLRHVWIAWLCTLMGMTFVLDATSPSFIYKDMGYLYNDGHYIASVAKNIVSGHGVSYWDGLTYRILDPEISSGPTVFLPMAAALYAGMDEWTAFNLVPILVNMALFAWLLAKLPAQLPFRTFASICLAAAVISMSFQRWQWRLPLGEVPAALFLLLSIIHFTGNDRQEYDRYAFFKAGALWALAILSKMLVILTLPAFLFFILKDRERHRKLQHWIAGISMICLPYFMFCYLTMPQRDIVELLGRTLDYFLFNFSFGITDWYTERSGDELSFSQSLLTSLSYNIMNLPTISDNIGILKSSILASAGVIAFLFSLRMTNVRNETIITVCFAATFSIMLWYFLAGQHGGRYFFVAGYTSIWCLIFLTCLQKIRGKQIAALFNIALALSFVSLGRSWIFPAKSDFSHIGEMTSLSRTIEEKNIGRILASISVFHGYPKIAYYLDDSRYLMFPAYLENEAELVSPGSCDLEKEDRFIPEDGVIRNPLVQCLIQQPGTPIVFRWKNDEPGFFLKRIPEYQKGSYIQDCRIKLFESARYVLQQCRKSTLSKIIARQSDNRIIVEPAISPPG